MCENHQYTLHLHASQHGKPVRLQEFPSLELIYVDERISLCPSHYGKEIRCFWEGDVSVTLQKKGEQGARIVMNDHDAKHSYRTILDGYEFQGQSVRVDNQSPNEVYLLFTVCHHPDATSTSGGYTQTPQRVYHVGQPFIIDFIESTGTGYTWQLALPDEITLISNTYASHCDTSLGEDRPGCASTHSFVLKGVKAGQVKIHALYNQPWNKTSESESREYEITLL